MFINYYKTARRRAGYVYNKYKFPIDHKEEKQEELLAIDRYNKFYKNNSSNKSIIEFNDYSKKFNKIVIWGLRNRWSTHRYIHKHFFMSLKKLGADVIWVEDIAKNGRYIKENDLVISVNTAGFKLPLIDNVYYCLHKIDDNNHIFDDNFHDVLDPKKNIRLQVFRNSYNIPSDTIKLANITVFDTHTRTLYQPWGTDLFPDEFYKPIYNKNTNIVYWVGSIWETKNGWGNANEINILKSALEKRNIKFIHKENVSDADNIQYVRVSRISPAISGKTQVDQNYLPCRLFKNISYGQLGISNVLKFSEILEQSFLNGNSIEEIIDISLSLSENQYINLVLEQQEKIKTHTYLHKLTNIMKSFDYI